MKKRDLRRIILEQEREISGLRGLVLDLMPSTMGVLELRTGGDPAVLSFPINPSLERTVIDLPAIGFDVVRRGPPEEPTLMDLHRAAERWGGADIEPARPSNGFRDPDL
jgi:hypothetical protein